MLPDKKNTTDTSARTNTATNEQSLWQNLSSSIIEKINRNNFERWFCDAFIDELAIKNDVPFVKIAIANEIHRLWIEQNFYDALQQCAKENQLSHIELCIAQKTHQTTNQENFQNQNQQTTPLHAQNSPTHTSSKKSTNTVNPHPSTAPAETTATTKKSATPSQYRTGLVASNTFERFVVGASNQFAHAASLGVAEKPANQFNPLFIHGDSGLGKTHLMHAIGHRTMERRPDTKVIYTTSEQFINGYIDSLQTQSIAKFRRSFRKVDILLIDDIQFLAGKDRSQEEFFHTFNHLIDGNRQIVLTSDRPASQIAKLEDRLVSRFTCGLTVELAPPDVETRLAILRMKADKLTHPPSEELMQFIAANITQNIRDLEGALIRVAGFVELQNGIHLSIADARYLLRDLLKKNTIKKVSIDKIQKTVAHHFDLRVTDLLSKRRPASIAHPRQIAMYLARNFTTASLAEIGQAFGGRDHGTVMHACRTIEKKSTTNTTLTDTLDLLRTTLQNDEEK